MTDTANELIAQARREPPPTEMRRLALALADALETAQGDIGKLFGTIGRLMERESAAEAEKARLREALAALVWSLDGIWAVVGASSPEHPFHVALPAARAALGGERDG